jgi:predicted TIM-barrel fold metal-dependent hydrolase
MTDTLGQHWGVRQTERSLIDADVHVDVPSIQTLFPYLDDYWREICTKASFRGPVDSSYPAGMATAARPGTRPAPGRPPGSDLDFVRAHVLDAWNADYAILNCAYAIESVRHHYGAAAVASAVNDWLIAEWLAKDSRLRASLVVASQQPQLAAREIDRVGDHPGFVQVYLPVRSWLPYGNPICRPIFDAAARHDLVVELHFGGVTPNPPTSAGWPSFYLEEYANMATNFASNLMSLIVEGVFDEFPTLRLTLGESGFSWLPPYLWRLDKEWRGLRREVPWTQRPPSAYVREHVRITLQPNDAPPEPGRLLQLIDQVGSEDLLMFATDYPHRHFDQPEEAVPAGLPESLTRKIMSENAREWYRLR